MQIDGESPYMASEPYCFEVDCPLSNDASTFPYHKIVELTWAITNFVYLGNNVVRFPRLDEEVSCVQYQIDQDMSMTQIMESRTEVKEAFEASKDGVHDQTAMTELSDLVRNAVLFVTYSDQEPCKGTKFDKMAILVRTRKSKSKIQFALHLLHKQIESHKLVLIADTMKQIYQSIMEGHDFSLLELEILGPENLQCLVQWAQEPRKVTDMNLIDIFVRQVQARPNALMAESWDGSLTYADVLYHARNLAAGLLKQGVKVHDPVMMSLRKSKWAVSAILGILLTGGVCVPLDIRSPPARAEQLSKSLGCQCAVVDSSTLSMFRNMGLKTLIVTQEDEHPAPPLSAFPRPSPESAAFIIFTSGSTGLPKAVVQGHGAIYASLEEVSRAFSIDDTSRVLQYAAFTFDVSIGDIFGTAIQGGCVCLPSEDERLDSLPESMARYSVTHACLTTTTLTRIPTDSVPTLKYLFIGGEPLSRDHFMKWKDHVNIHVVYGTTEGAAWDSMASSVMLDNDERSIGHGMGVSLWIVDPVSQRRQPIGCTGEILVEGPLLARGYAKGTEEVHNRRFGHAPMWLQRLRGVEEVHCYRTGDLGRYNPDGSITFIGRADTQIKINGQRVELGEIEHSLRKCGTTFSEVAVEALKTADRANVKSLTAFIRLHCSDAAAINDTTDTKSHSSGDHPFLHLNSDIQASFKEAQRALLATLPRYMVPSLFIAVREMPLTVSGKLDRKKLQHWMLFLSADELKPYYLLDEKARRAPKTYKERMLIEISAAALKIPESDISVDDHFFQLGGDSVMAMELVAAARTLGWPLTVAEVSQYPQFCDMVRLWESSSSAEIITKIEPFSLVQDKVNIEQCVQDIARECQTGSQFIEDVYPCSALQEALMAISARQPQAYTHRVVFPIQPSVDLDRFKLAWDSLVSTHAILRTRVVFTSNLGSVQVVLSTQKAPVWRSHPSLREYLLQDKEAPMRYGTELNRLAIVGQPGDWTFVWSIHHAMYDGWCLPILFEEVRQIYQGLHIEPEIPYTRFIQHLGQLDSESADIFWRKQFPDVVSSYPRLPSVDYIPHPDQKMLKTISLARKPGSEITTATMIQATWALIMDQLLDTDQAVFGLTLSGRDVPVAGILKMIGPTMTTIPIRIDIDYTKPVVEFLRDMQDQILAVRQYQHVGLQHIQQLGIEARSAVDFRNILVIHPDQSARRRTVGDQHPLATLGLERVQSEEADFTEYPLVIQCEITATSIEFEVQYDNMVISEAELSGLLYRFEHVLGQLKEESSEVSVHNIDMVSPNDLKRMMTWNQTMPVAMQTTVHQLMEEQALARPGAIAISSFDGEYTYTQVDRMATALAQYLNTPHGIGLEMKVPLCFAKSTPALVVMLAVLKSGGVCVSINPEHPQSRLLGIIKDVEASIVLCDPDKVGIFTNQVPTVVGIDLPLLNSLISSEKSSSILPEVLPSNGAFVIFTSGSTGKPKGSLLEHRSLCTSFLANGQPTQMGYDTRTLQFAAFTFDVSIFEVFATWASGGCVCLPSEDQRMSNLIDMINERQVNWAMVTPTVANLLSPELIPCLRTMLLCGEPMTLQLVHSWAEAVMLCNSWGPSECSVGAALNTNVSSSSDPSNIGTAVGCNIWIAQRHRSDRLVPIGCVGELLIEGPIVGRGYINRPKATATAFIKDPLWSRSQQGHTKTSRSFYRTGDLGRYNPDGSITFHGRADTQVKIHGQRVELAEIENQICRSLRSGSAVIVDLCPLADSQGEVLLIAFLQLNQPKNLDPSKSSSSPVDPLEQSSTGHNMCQNHLSTSSKRFLSQIKTTISGALPQHMVPSLFYVMESLPLTSSGKVDRRSLRAQANQMKKLDFFSPDNVGTLKAKPANEIERRLQQIWSTVLHVSVEDIGVEDMFTFLGGNSITAMQMVAECRQSGLKLSVASILRYKTIRLIAPHCEQKQVRSFDRIYKDDETPFQLSPVQKMYFEMENMQSSKSIQSFLLQIRSKVSAENVEKAFDIIVEQHPMLRARFQRQSKIVWEQMIPKSRLQCYKFASHHTDVGSSFIESQARESVKSLDIVHGPLFSVDFFETQHEYPIVFLASHHLVVDLVSWRIIWHDLEQILRTGSLSMQPSLPFREWCKLQASQVQMKNGATISAFTAIPPSNYAFWGVATHENTMQQAEELSFDIDISTTSLLLGKANDALRTEPIDVLIGLLMLTFSSSFSMRELPAIHVEHHGRDAWDDGFSVDRTVGWFTTLYPVYAPIMTGTPLLDALRMVKDKRRHNQQNGRLLFAHRHLNPEDTSIHQHPDDPEILLNYSGRFEQLEAQDSLLHVEHHAQVDLTDVVGDVRRWGLVEIYVEITNGSMKFSISFNRNMKHRELFQGWMKGFQTALIQATQTLANAQPIPTLSDFSLPSISYKELDRLVYDKLRQVGLKDFSEIEDIYPCTVMQEGILLSQRKDEEMYQITSAWEYLHPDGHDRSLQHRVTTAWQSMVDRHAALRTGIIECGLRQAFFAQVVIRRTKVQIVQQEDAIDDVSDILSISPVCKSGFWRHLPQLILAYTRDGRLVCRLDASHVMLDGNSVDLLISELLDRVANKYTQKPVLEFKDFVSYEKSLPTEVNVKYWTKYVGAVQPCHMPAQQQDGNPDSKYRSYEVHEDFTHAINEFCQRVGITKFALIQVAWAVVLSIFTGQEEVCFGYVVSRRDAPLAGIQDAVGIFLNMLPCRVKLVGTALEVLSKVQNDNIAAFEHSNCSLAAIQNSLGLGTTPLFNTCLSMRRDDDKAGSTDQLYHIKSSDVLDATEYNIAVSAAASDTKVKVLLVFNTDKVSVDHGNNIGQTFEAVLTNLTAQEATSIREIEVVDQRAKDKMATWNNTMPAAVQATVHELVEQQALAMPNAVAISSFDGEYTYNEIDNMATSLAYYLTSLGVGPELRVPLCFTKSTWALVTMLAVLKSGGVCVSVNPDHPLPRLLGIFKDVEGMILLCDPYNVDRFKEQVPIVVGVDLSLLHALPRLSNRSESILPKVLPSNAAFVVFTSGSTGQPKGSVLEHQSLCTNLKTFGHALGMNQHTRTIQIAAFTFDGSIFEVFATWAHGACVCLPSEDERMSDVIGIINRRRVNLALLTPTVASLLSPRLVPSLRTLALVGEAVNIQLIRDWADEVLLCNWWGPSECSIGATIQTNLSTSSQPSNIGKATGCHVWVTDLKHPDRLVPIGCVGELLIEGPVVGRGYINRPEATKAAFITDPVWSRGQAEQPRRFYRSGDLGRYNADGSITFVGRADTQVKIRGQRVELSEIEHQLRQCGSIFTEVTVEVLTTADRADIKTLTAFISYQPETSLNGSADIISVSSNDGFILSLDRELQAHFKRGQQVLSASLPRYMVPSLFIPVRKMPLTVSGKLDRTTLRRWVSSLGTEELAPYYLSELGSLRPPKTETEQRLVEMWAAALRVPDSSIGLDDNFFQLGGDSVMAMELVATARALGWSVTVAEVFQYPQLGNMAQLWDNSSPLQEPDALIQPMALIKDSVDVEQSVREVAQECHTNPESIEDIYPCSAMQEALMAISAHQPQTYIHRVIFRIPSSIVLPRFKAAWETLQSTHVLVRTRIVIAKTLGSVQTVLKCPLLWRSATSLQQYLQQDKEIPMQYGTELNRFAIVGQPGEWTFVWSIHHAIYDGWTFPRLLQKIQQIYEGEQPSIEVPYNRFIQYLTKLDLKKSDIFWRNQFPEVLDSYPRYPHIGYVPRPQRRMRIKVNITRRGGSEITTATMIQASWALIMARLASMDQCIFGLTLSGRDAPVVGITQMMGPTMTSVPFRVKIDHSKTVVDFLRDVQSQVMAVRQHQYTGLQRIRRSSVEAQSAVGFRNILDVHAEHTTEDQDQFLGLERIENDEAHFTDYALIIQCGITSTSVEIEAQYDSAVIPDEELHGLLQQLEHVLHQVMNESSDTPVEGIDMVSPYDLERLSLWNPVLQPAVQSTVHELVEKQVLIRPNALAISSFDGNYTFAELDSMASTLSHHLVALGVKLETRVPLCFAKSTYAVVAMLAVLKSGGVCVSVNPEHPLSRLLGIFNDVEATVVLCDPNNVDRFKEQILHVVGVDALLLGTLPRLSGLVLSKVLPQNAAFIVFTSGSTGKPKGSVLEHQSVSTSLLANGKAADMNTETRTLQFAAFTFDASVCEIFSTWAYGGCLCIASDDERMSDLANVINRYLVNWVMLTPTVANLLSPQMVPCLRILVLGGEAVTPEILDKWAEKVMLCNYWGPSECSNQGTWYTNVNISSDPCNIGKALGCHVWITERNQPNRLVPVGCVGELMIEGPNVGRGYVNRPDATLAAFITDLVWSREHLRQSQGPDTKQVRRFYRTGDLGRQNHDGSITFIGRSDTQVKIRGQRVELGEIEHSLRKCDSSFQEVAVQILSIASRADVQTLAAFICWQSNEACDVGEEDPSLGCGLDGNQILPLSSKIQASFKEVQRTLLASLPRYMVPSIFIPVRKMPLTVSDKLDRKTMRLWVSSLTTEQLMPYYLADVSTRRCPESEIERQLARLWAEALRVSESSISLDDHFFQLGGDSVMAMELVAAARTLGWTLTVAKVFQCPQLQAMAQLWEGVSSSVQEESIVPIKPMALIQETINLRRYIQEIAEECQITANSIEDLYPCSAMQEALMAISAHQPQAYTHQAVFKIPASLDIDRFKFAWEALVSTHAILRTRIVTVHGLGTVQVVLRDSPVWYSHTSIEQYLQQDRENPMRYGTRLNGLAIVGHGQSGDLTFVWSMHHAIYDGWSLPRLYQKVKRIYLGEEVPAEVPYNHFIRHLTQLDLETSATFWRNQFPEIAESYPRLPSTSYVPRPHSKMRRRISLKRKAGSEITVATILQTAWALVMTQLVDTDQSVFGLTLSGRDAPVAGIMQIMGPTITTVPACLNVDKSKTILQTLQEVQHQVLDIKQHQHTGLQFIRRLSFTAQAAVDFHNLLVIHAGEVAEQLDPMDALGLKQVEYHEGDFTSYALTVQCEVMSGYIETDIQYDNSVISEDELNGALHRFEYVLSQLVTESSSTNINEIDMVSSYDLERMAQWYQTTPTAVESTIPQLIKSQLLARPNAIAISSFDGEYTYAELDRMATALAHRLLPLGIGPEIRVPLCFTKSTTALVTMLAVLKAGGVCVSVNPEHPLPRLLGIFEDVGATIVLCDPCDTDRFKQIQHVVGVDLSWLKSLPHPQETRGLAAPLPEVLPNNAAFIIFTSGSTGKPKGSLLEHRSLCTSFMTNGQPAQMGRDTRTLQFAAFTFDVSIFEIFATWTHGGCVCVASTEDNMNNLAGVIANKQVNWAMLTPTVAKLISPSTSPCLRTLVLCGEPMTKELVQTWAEELTLINSWGPSECSVGATLNVDMNSSCNPTNIGKAIYGCHIWITEKHQPDRLTPIGIVGELLIEGPIIGRGYVNRPEATAAAFITDPIWSHNQPRQSRPYKGTRRFYRTGDLGRFNYDGSITFIGRADKQVKIRGQRVELGEIEHLLRKCDDSMFTEVAVEVLATTDRPEIKNLTAFICYKVDAAVHSDSSSNSNPDAELSSDSQSENEVPILSLNSEMQASFREAQRVLTAALPRYMVPSLFIPVRRMPLTVSGKLDRLALRSLFTSLSIDELTPYHLVDVNPQRYPETDRERKLAKLWADALRIPEMSIGLDDHFFHLGGDSVIAMELVAAVRASGWRLTVAQVFKCPRFCNMVHLWEASHQVGAEIIRPIEPMSLLPAKADLQTVQEIAGECQISPDSIEDIYPCSAMQEALMAISAHQPEAYINRVVFRLPSSIDLGRFKSAWETLVSMHGILRTRIIVKQSLGSLQVVLRKSSVWYSYTGSLEQYLCEDRKNPMHYGAELSRLTIIDDQPNNQVFVWSIHHSLYDGWSLTRLLEGVKQIYDGNHIQPEVPYNQFIQHLVQLDSEQSDAFWRGQFPEVVDSYPRLPSVDYTPRPHQQMQRFVRYTKKAESEITTATVIQATWALIMARLVDTEHFVFGLTLSGRDAPITGITRMMGPTITTVPHHVNLNDRTKSVIEFLRDVQDQVLAMKHYQHAGLQRIRRLGVEAQSAVNFRNILVVHADRSFRERALVNQDPLAAMGLEQIQQEETDFTEYALVVQCEITPKGINIEVQYDGFVVPEDELTGILHRFEHVLLQLAEESTTTNDDIAIVSPYDLDKLLSWNQALPAAVQSTVHGLVEEQAQLRPHNIAISSYDGEYTFAELNSMATALAHRYLLPLGIGPEVVVPLCFRKSTSILVAMLAVLKAGGVCVMVNPEHPLPRLLGIFEDVEAILVLCDTDVVGRFGGQSFKVKGLDLSLLKTLLYPQDTPPQDTSKLVLPNVLPNNAAFIVFTSGSTGKPKGSVLEHQSVCTSLLAHGELGKMKSSTRTLQFAAFTFDVSILETFGTWLHGGCVCLPSDDERMSDLAGVVNAREVNWAMVTPTVARLLSPETIPGLETLVLCGEPMSLELVQTWEGKLTLCNHWGPSECSNAGTWGNNVNSQKNISNIGKAINCHIWVTERQRPDRLVPVGCVGELLIEGPNVGRGYINRPEATAAAFITDPAWSRGQTGQPDQVKKSRRFYRTGDLGRYNYDGSITFFGRADTQIKIRGQRVELGEIEHSLRKSEPTFSEVVVQVLTTTDRAEVEILTAFVCCGPDSDLHSSNETSILPLSSSLQVRFKNAQRALMASLPRYMVPSLFIPVRQMPLTASGKLDRKVLRNWVSSLTAEQLMPYHLANTSSLRPPETPTEKKLANLWAAALRTPNSSIGLDDHFFHLGGDSVMAMELVAAARASGYTLTVAKVFQNPHLCDMARLWEESSPEEGFVFHLPEPLSLLDDQTTTTTEKDTIYDDISALLGVKEDSIQDIYPVTDFQKSAISASLARPTGGCHYFFIDLPRGTNIDQLEKACVSAWDHLDILRTVFVKYRDQLLQVVSRHLQPEITVTQTTENMATFCQSQYEEDRGTYLKLGTSFVRFFLTHNSDNDVRLTMRLSHALYDGISKRQIMACIADSYDGQALTCISSFAGYMKHVQIQQKLGRTFWQKLLGGAKLSRMPCDNDQISSTRTILLTNTLSAPRTRTDITHANIFGAVCANTIAEVTNSEDVVFGLLVSGRAAFPAALQGTTGPCLNTIPLRVALQKGQTIVQTAKELQQQRLESLAFETSQLSDIVQHCTDWGNGNNNSDSVSNEKHDFGFTVQFQNIDETPMIEDSSSLTGKLEVYSPQEPLDTERVIIFVNPREDKWEVKIGACSKYHSHASIARVMQSFERLLQQTLG